MSADDDDVIINQSGGAWCMEAVTGAEQKQDPPLNKCFSGKTIMSSLIGWLVGHHHDVISLHTLQQGVHHAIITP